MTVEQQGFILYNETIHNQKSPQRLNNSCICTEKTNSAENQLCLFYQSCVLQRRGERDGFDSEDEISRGS